MASADRRAASWACGTRVLLCADDYAMTEGVSAGIEELISAGRLSATSAIVTSRHWRSHAHRLAASRAHAAVGLHLNLTLGSPLGPMPHLAPSRHFPRIGELVRRALSGRLDEAEIAGEISRQLDEFENVFGHPPDMVDGHQHVQVLPHIRGPLLRVLSERYPRTKPLLRIPADPIVAIWMRRTAGLKALGLSVLSAGFGARARASGFATNSGFSGVSSFDERVPYADELKRFFVRTGPLHIIMCHPGYPDEELACIDPVVGRRLAELETLRDDPDLPARVHHPSRDEKGRISWGAADG